MLHYEAFERAVGKAAGSEAKEWGHLLPAIPYEHRFRYIDALQKGLRPPQAYDCVMYCQNEQEEQFYALLQETVTQKE